MPEAGQLTSWERVLGNFPVSIVDHALDQWQGRTDEDQFTGKAVGRLMPSAADLKAIIEANDRKSVAGNRYMPCGENGCVEGLVFFRKDGTIWDWKRDQGESKYARDCRCKIEWRNGVSRDYEHARVQGQ